MTFVTFIHLTNTFIQRDLHSIKHTHFISSLSFP